MNKNEYLQSTAVLDFIAWTEERLDQRGSFTHTYCMKKPMQIWECHSIYSAFENYCWPFTYKDPDTGEKVQGLTFNDSMASLTKLSAGLKRSIADNDVEACRNHCFSILDWGGVLAKNDIKINQLGENICRYLSDVKILFSSDLSCEKYYHEPMIMNSGFTKIYSLYMDDFIIYDGRVGAALGLMVRKFLEDQAMVSVPKELSFAWGKGKESVYKISNENKRNPGNEKYKFPELLNNPKRHAENNIRANWLLRAMIDQTESSFRALQNEVQLRALEAALFMIGYQVASDT
jgi:hypothetical protein